MPRKPDPTRKPELLGQIVDHLTTRTLATVSFRTLAEALGVSTYVFVYHFGNRAQLVDEIVRAVIRRQDALLDAQATTLGHAAWREHLVEAWQRLSTPQHLQLVRLETEAALLEVVDGVEDGVARAAAGRWRRHVEAWALEQGVDDDDAATAATAFDAAVRGLQYDLLVGVDIARAGAAFERQVDAFLDEVVDRVDAAA